MCNTFFRIRYINYIGWMLHICRLLFTFVVFTVPTFDFDQLHCHTNTANFSSFLCHSDQLRSNVYLYFVQNDAFICGCIFYYKENNIKCEAGSLQKSIWSRFII